MKNVVFLHLQQTLMKSRIDILDIAKALAIFLVVMGHAVGNLDTPFWRLVIYTFHMPLFFLVAGMVVKPVEVTERGTFISFLKKNSLTLAVPYFIWAVIYSQFSYNHLGYILYGSWECLYKGQTSTSLWFLSCLFSARIMVELVFRALGRVQSHRNLMLAIAGILFFAVGIALPHPRAELQTGFIGYFWCFDVALVASGFMILGHLLLTPVRRLGNVKTPWIFLGILLSVALLYCGCNTQTRALVGVEPLGLVDFCFKGLENIPLMFTNSISGCAIIIFLSVLISRYLWTTGKEFVLYVGQNTIGIFLLHKNLLQEIVVPLFAKMGFATAEMYVAFMAAVIAFIFSVIMVKLILKYAPPMLGRFSIKQ